MELSTLEEKIEEYEKKCDYLKQQAIAAEEKEMQALLELEKAVTKVSSEDMMVLSDEEDNNTAPVLHLNKVIQKEYLDDTSIDVFVNDTAKATNRSLSKASEWIQKLKDQDIMTVGDLKELLDEDWLSIGLTVFSIRALKNMLRNIECSSSI